MPPDYSGLRVDNAALAETVLYDDGLKRGATDTRCGFSLAIYSS